MKIETERFELLALSPGQLLMWINDLDSFESSMNLKYRGDSLESPFGDIVRGQAEICQADPENYMWHSFWLMLRKSDHVVVGSIDFKAPPNNSGEVEIGYGLEKCFEHRGYMSECVKALCIWALGQNGVRCVIAETETDNLASQRILTKCGFREYAAKATIWWRLQP